MRSEPGIWSIEIKPFFVLYLFRFVKFAHSGNAKIPGITCLSTHFVISPAQMCHLSKDGGLLMQMHPQDKSSGGPFQISCHF